MFEDMKRNMKNGKRKMKKEKWKRKMKNEKWKLKNENEKWKSKNEKQKTKNEKWQTIFVELGNDKLQLNPNTFNPSKGKDCQLSSMVGRMERHGC